MCNEETIVFLVKNVGVEGYPVYEVVKKMPYRELKEAYKNGKVYYNLGGKRFIEIDQKLNKEIKQMDEEENDYIKKISKCPYTRRYKHRSCNGECKTCEYRYSKTASLDAMHENNVYPENGVAFLDSGLEDRECVDQFLDKVIDDLEDIDYKVFMLGYLQHMSERTTAELLGLKRGYVHNKMKKLEKKIEDFRAGW